MSTSEIKVGAHVRDADPLVTAAELEADVVQFFLADPQKWHKPKPRPDAEELRGSAVQVFIHAPYIVNVASTNNRIRIPSRKIMREHATAAETVGARGLIVHGGHVTKDDDPAAGADNWRKAFAEAHEKYGGFDTPILIENTAGGDHSMARRLDALARLWDAVGDYNPGFCLDTCHAHAGGIDLVTAVEKVKAITGRIDLVHCNDSRDEFDSGRDRHATIGTGKIDPKLLQEVVLAAGAPVVVETPGEGQADDIAFLRAAL
ncbi:deoxyribonuclease IV [Blastococcus sp. Marseille-P5729]|uniref:deoxyribonuclease IV n=1 Tax=Blastococcus sp. Marseille-P5729 TaxID=2086582 RepID=UPI001F230873|nr:deoxyribonuclease IV [Blastococcus sp. Marseille-P5729]